MFYLGHVNPAAPDRQVFSQIPVRRAGEMGGFRRMKPVLHEGSLYTDETWLCGKEFTRMKKSIQYGFDAGAAFCFVRTGVCYRRTSADTGGKGSALYEV